MAEKRFIGDAAIMGSMVPLQRKKEKGISKIMRKTQAGKADRKGVAYSIVACLSH